MVRQQMLQDLQRVSVFLLSCEQSSSQKSIKKFSFRVEVCYKFIFMKQWRYTRNFFII